MEPDLARAERMIRREFAAPEFQAIHERLSDRAAELSAALRAAGFPADQAATAAVNLVLFGSLRLPDPDPPFGNRP